MQTFHKLGENLCTASFFFFSISLLFSYKDLFSHGGKKKSHLRLIDMKHRDCFKLYMRINLKLAAGLKLTIKWE